MPLQIALSRLQGPLIAVFPAVPDDVTSACVLLARDLYKEMKSAPFGIADFGGDGPIRVGAHRTARMLLDPYRKASVG